MFEMAVEEARKAGCGRLLSVSVQYGQISGIMPEALRMAFDALVRGTPHEGAALCMELVPLRLRCLFCGLEFAAADCQNALAPCPGCGEVVGHAILSGRELVLARVEAAP